MFVMFKDFRMILNIKILQIKLYNALLRGIKIINLLIILIVKQ